MNETISPSLSGDVTQRSDYRQKAQYFLGNLFNKASSKQLKQAEQNIKIKKIVNRPLTYCVVESFFEQRSIFNHEEPAGHHQADSDHMRDADEFDRWQVSCPPPEQLFAPETNYITVPKTKFIQPCSTCHSNGYVPCTCGDGRETCSSCGGSGEVSCGSCGGYGAVSCHYCGGYGYNTYHRQGYNQDGTPVFYDEKETCGYCGGSGTVSCSHCGGSGVLTCSHCSGSGSVTCHICGGEKKVTCSRCSGNGHVCNSVQVKQIYDCDRLLQLIDSYQIEPAVFADQQFAPFQPSDDDRILETRRDTKPLNTLPLNQLLPEQHSDPYSISQLMEQLQQLCQQEEEDSKRILQYQYSIYQRDVLDIEYEFQNRTYRIVIDCSTNENLMDKNPYEYAAQNIIQELEQNRKNLAFRSFLNNYEEFCSITQFNNISFSEKDIRKQMTLLRLIMLGVACLGILVACCGMELIILEFPSNYRFSTSFGRILSIILSVALTNFIFDKLWKKVASDNKKIMLPTIFFTGFLLVILITRLLHMIGFV